MLEFLTDWLQRLLRQPAKLMYIGGSDILPPPLAAQEEQTLLQQAAAGDEAARARLIERNLRLVVYIARRFENTGVNIEDLISDHRPHQGRRHIQIGPEHQAGDLCLALHRE